MDNLIIYILIGLIIVGAISIFALGKNVTKVVKTKDEKKEEIKDKYRQQLRVLLIEATDKKQRVVIKKELLCKCSAELSLNIFFDAADIREMILELSQMD